MRVLLSTLLFLVPSLLFGQNCEEFKTGEFYVKDDFGNRMPGYTIKRTKKKQIERAVGGYIKTKVVSTSDCTYDLIHIKSDILDLPKGTVTTVKIVRTFEGGYDGVGYSEIADKPVRFTMYTID